MDLERERGITIKAQTAALTYKARDGETYQLNLIDTPGHVDFAYEVSRSLAACEGALLVVDASQGVEAQTVANCYTAIEQGVDGRAGAQQDRPAVGRARARDRRDRGHHRHPTRSDAIRASAKTGEGVDDILEAVIARIPPPQRRSASAAAGADHRFVVRQLRRRRDAGARDATATLKPKDKILLDGDGRDATTASRSACSRRSRWRATQLVGRRRRLRHRRHQGAQGGAGRRHGHARARGRRAQPLPGFKEVKPQVFAGLYPVGVEPVRGAARRARQAAS